jgi:proteasome assembly chaperone (PAC2) family protein
MPKSTDLVHYYSDIKPRRCDLVAAWPGVGNVSLILTQYLVEHLGADQFAEIEPAAFFNATGVLVRDNVVEEPQFPASRFFFWQNPEKRGKDLIFFIGDEQPPSGSYELANVVLDVAKKYKVRRIYTMAAALVKIHHSEAPRVWATATEEKLLKEVTKFEVVLRGTVQIAGLNGILLGVAKERGLPGVCLLGETPMYATRIPNPKAALAVGNILVKLLNVQVDLAELAESAHKAEAEMAKLTADAMTEFIDHFTTPVWESEEHRGEEEEEE